MGLQVAEFTIPNEVPNGDAFVFWKCAGQSPMCNQATMSGGTEDVENIVNELNGTIECLNPIATQTSISTSIGSSTTAFATLLSTLFTTSSTSISAGAVTIAIIPANKTTSNPPVALTSAVSTLATSVSSAGPGTFRVTQSSIAGQSASSITAVGSAGAPSGQSLSSVASSVTSSVVSVIYQTITTTMTAPCTTTAVAR
ncbi:uncharacterized protein LY89DRAFT_670721 [Mollisia scopiformis]|uniref:Uncharacterized protein n=1 Tax=Mollisia scopiformis TaxID=149040 RepID=A0A194X5Y1_MOLSC|nr:uncharacterized protein LY89DRAFT_670721 [Mollisia scopiformis]KUJ15591.1 hypothetical protein LY89DRAFT_670721 [Mollisia scopiformis]